MSNILIKGILPAMITPLSKSGEVLENSIELNMNKNYSAGAAGFYICGSTGEGPVLTAEKRMKTAEAVMRFNSGRGKIINHVGASSPEEAFCLARHAEKIGCDAVSSVVPNFYYKYNDDEIIEYYKRLADEAKLPVIAYAQSLYTGDITALMKKLIKIDGVIGVKFTLTDFYAMHRIKELNSGDINVINGPDEMLICGLSMGADAGIGSTYNIMCGEYVKLFNAFGEGDINTARSQQYKINKIITILIKYGVIRSIKYILTLQGIESGSSVFPGAELSGEEKKALENELRENNFFTEYNN